MDLEELKTEIAASADYKDLDQAAWEMKIEVRTADVKYDADLQHAISCYVRKIPLLREMFLVPLVKLNNPDDSLRTLQEVQDDQLDARQDILTKLDRQIDKLACCLKEQELRKAGLVTRTPHHTDYYIDYGAANDTGTGLNATGQEWKTITKYTTDTVRSAGDRAFLRANVTWTQGTEAKDITFDEDGTKDAFIELIGCDSVTNDPWSDASDVKPIIDFENASYQMAMISDIYWKMTRVKLMQTIDTSGLLIMQYAHYNYILECDFTDCGAANTEGINVSNTHQFIIDGCTFTDCWTNSITVGFSSGSINGCTLTAGADVSTDTGIVIDVSTIWMRDTTFVATFDTRDVDLSNGSILYCRNIDWSGKGVRTQQTAAIYSEDEDATFEAQLTTFLEGTIARDTATVRGGGADSSAKMSPTTSCGVNNPVILGSKLSGFRPIWVTAGSYTATVYARVGAAWTGALTAAQAYLVTSELDTAPARTERQSTETIANNGDWTAFTTSITPSSDGFVYFWFYLAHREDTADIIYVDILPTVA